jgi:hypothetical protein
MSAKEPAMTADMWLRALQWAADRARSSGSNARLRMFAQTLHEAEQATQALRDRGYGWLGLGLLDTILQCVPPAGEAPVAGHRRPLPRGADGRPEYDDYTY